MTDKEILETIYRWIQQANSRDENPDHTRQRLKDCQDFIEQEWQKHDDPQQQSKALGQFSKTWYEADARREDERHRGLVIGEDGTVESLE
mgnify:FL=1|jgi:hypothetical protein